MVKTDEFERLVSCWNLVPAAKFGPLVPGAAAGASLPAPDFVLTSLTAELFELYLKQAEIGDAAGYCLDADGERFTQNALDSLNRLFACQPGEVVEAFATYLSPSERYIDGPWNGQRQEIASSNAVSRGPRDRQVCIETAAKDHVIHLETMILAEEQEVPTASAVGQMLISGRELWMRCKEKLLNSLSKCSRNRSTAGFQIASASAEPASSY